MPSSATKPIIAHLKGVWFCGGGFTFFVGAFVEWHPVVVVVDICCIIPWKTRVSKIAYCWHSGIYNTTAVYFAWNDRNTLHAHLLKFPERNLFGVWSIPSTMPDLVRFTRSICCSTSHFLEWLKVPSCWAVMYIDRIKPDENHPNRKYHSLYLNDKKHWNRYGSMNSHQQKRNATL